MSLLFPGLAAVTGLDPIDELLPLRLGELILRSLRLSEPGDLPLPPVPLPPIVGIGALP